MFTDPSYTVNLSDMDGALSKLEWERHQAKANHPVTWLPDHYDIRRSGAAEGLATTGGQAIRSSVPLNAHTEAERLRWEAAGRSSRGRQRQAS